MVISSDIGNEIDMMEVRALQHTAETLRDKICFLQADKIKGFNTADRIKDYIKEKAKTCKNCQLLKRHLLSTGFSDSIIIFVTHNLI